MLNKIAVEDIIEIAKRASLVILSVYNDDFDVQKKSDSSPVTKADLLANSTIVDALNSLDIKLPIISEESEVAPYNIRKKWSYFWLVDPLDGTKEFIKRNGEFSVNIALIHKNKPVLGVVLAPISNIVYYAKLGDGAFMKNLNDSTLQKLPLKQNRYIKESISVAISGSHQSKKVQTYIDELAKRTKNIQLKQMGSSLKFCLIASGEVDIYPRLSDTMEWDSAAAHIIINEAGGAILEYNTNKEIAYNKISLLNPNFIALLNKEILTL